MRAGFVTLILIVVAAAQTASEPPRVSIQTNFGLEEPFEKPALVPDEVLQDLRKIEGKQISRCLERENQRPFGKNWFEASAIDLNDDQRMDLVIRPSTVGWCLAGANVAPFYVFLNRDVGYMPLLRVVTLSLVVKDTKTNGFRDIDVARATAVEVVEAEFRYNGKGYVMKRRTGSTTCVDTGKRGPCERN